METFKSRKVLCLFFVWWLRGSTRVNFPGRSICCAKVPHKVSFFTSALALDKILQWIILRTRIYDCRLVLYVQEWWRIC